MRVSYCANEYEIDDIEIESDLENASSDEERARIALQFWLDKIPDPDNPNEQADSWCFSHARSPFSTEMVIWAKHGENTVSLLINW